eukprot:396351-Rhodomonas_salina.4
MFRNNPPHPCGTKQYRQGGRLFRNITVASFDRASIREAHHHTPEPPGHIPGRERAYRGLRYAGRPTGQTSRRSLRDRTATLDPSAL